MYGDGDCKALSTSSSDEVQVNPYSVIQSSWSCHYTTEKKNNPESYCEFQFIYTIVLAHPPLQAFLTPLEVTQTT